MGFRNPPSPNHLESPKSSREYQRKNRSHVKSRRRLAILGLVPNDRRGISDANFYVSPPHESTLGNVGFLAQDDSVRPVQNHPTQTTNANECSHQLRKEQRRTSYYRNPIGRDGEEAYWNSVFGPRGDGRRYGQTVGRQDPGENARLQFDVRIRCERKSCAKK